MILQDIHDGEIPKPDQIADLAADFAETQEDWSQISAELAAVYMPPRSATSRCSRS